MSLTLLAPAKLTLSLRITGLRDDGFHLIDAEMVAVDLHDRLEVDPDGDGLVVVHDGVARLTLNRPEKLNALDTAAFDELDAHLAALEQQGGSIGCVVARIRCGRFFLRSGL